MYFIYFLLSFGNKKLCGSIDNGKVLKLEPKWCQFLSLNKYIYVFYLFQFMKKKTELAIQRSEIYIKRKKSYFILAIYRFFKFIFYNL